MKILSIILAAALSTIAISNANARDSFSVGINIGGYGYAPPPVVYYYPPPPPVYYGAPSTYYSAPVVRYAPVVSYRYYDGDRYHGYHRNWGNRDWDDNHHRGHHRHGRGHDRD
ncbi:MAG: hypothetical protein SFU55_06470 [Methylophilus sp.]|nr:hypothetical protein [Methylophilus sp.]